VALLLPSMLSTFLNLGIAPANVYYIGSGQVSVREALLANSRIYIFLIIIGLSFGVVAIIWKSELWFPGISQNLLWLALFVFPINLMQAYLLSFFKGLQRFNIFNLILLIHPFLFLIVVAVMAFLAIKNMAMILSYYLATLLIGSLVAFWQLKKILHDDEVKKETQYIKKSITYGLKAHLGNIFAFLNYKADIFLVNFFLGASSAGLYVVAVLIAERLWLISQAVSTVLFPRLSQLSHDEETRKQLTPLISRWVLVVTCAIGCVLCLIAYWLILIIFGSDYLGAVTPLLILIPGIVLGASSRVLAHDIAARGRPELNMYTSVFVVLINIAGNIILIQIYGLNGAALATTVAYSLNFILRLFIYGQFTGNRWTLSIIPSTQDIELFLQLFKKKLQ
ncbi:MAG: hypothetical protein D3904_02935, partial [Candidatus Electrothrix sp. EH2]|nr:hypothetical protein [Candidatus Electrothrix sp. EH2]